MIDKPYGVEMTDTQGRLTHRHFVDYEAAIIWANFVIKEMQMSVKMSFNGKEIVTPMIENL